MRILVEHSNYGLSNLGDVATLQAAAQQIEKLWPEAYIEVITSKGALLRGYCPTAYPLVDNWLDRYQQIRRLADHSAKVKDIPDSCVG
jgi:polysaccharide pyruvyl transferase WcaK-like protein